MIITDKVEITIVPANKGYYEKIIGHVVSIGQKIHVSIDQVPLKSSVLVKCKCDECFRVFDQRRYRDFSVCGHCKTKKRMKNNTYGTKNRTIDIPEHSILKSFIDRGVGKKGIASYFGVSIAVINGWLKSLDLEIRPYQGIKKLKTAKEEEELVKQLTELGGSSNVSEICSFLNITPSILRTLKKNFPGICINTKFDDWKKSKQKITDNLDYYIKENHTKTLKVIANENGISIEQLKDVLYENDIKVKYHSYTKSKGELEIRDFIRNLGHTCHSYMFNKKYEIDCYAQESKFGVEYCGEYWHRFDPIKDNKNYHKDKHDFFQALTINLMTVFESEWKSVEKRPILESMIRYRLNCDSISKIYARKCTIREISKKDADAFHKRNHISGTTSSCLNFGLFYHEKLVCVLSVIKSRFDRSYEYEISRFSSELDTSVIGGFSKLLKYFIKTYRVTSCMTYADKRFGEGKVYLLNGFEFLGQTSPNYWYMDKNGGNLESRMKYQKAKLKKKFPTLFDPNLTEFEIMTNAGYYKIFDCGSNKYGWNKK